MPKKCAIYTLGCKANQADGDQLAAQFLNSGFDIVSYKDTADIYVINTCTVTAKAAYQSRQAVRRFIRKNPDAKIIVTGCDVEFEKDVLEGIDGVSIVVGNAEKENIFLSFDKPVLSEFILRQACPERSRRVQDKLCEGEAISSESLAMTQRSRPFIKIQDGCEKYCSYCIVPYVRGKYRSTHPDEIIDAVRNLSEKGFYEIVLTGIHIGKYGVDLNMKFGLKNLIQCILVETDIGRIRLSSLEPDEIDSELIDLIAQSSGRICPHIHVPLQSGCDNILEEMNRRYTTADYGDLISEIKSKIPNVSIGADVITGFPCETDQEFEVGHKFIESLPITYLHTFSYSDRKGTEASKMSGNISEVVKRDRTHRLRELSTKKRRAYLQNQIGKEVTVVFENCHCDEQGGEASSRWSKGVSENYISVLVKGRKSSEKYNRIKLVDLFEESMIGEER